HRDRAHHLQGLGQEGIGIVVHVEALTEKGARSKGSGASRGTRDSELKPGSSGAALPLPYIGTMKSL
ncbi:MAG: hypothetical protein KDE02_02845, partial [Rhodobacteraceae bacterium]|nr:hypothetical protein [Paracoccaceae bacterium]